MYVPNKLHCQSGHDDTPSCTYYGECLPAQPGCIGHRQQMYTGITQIYGDLNRQRTNIGPLE